MSVIDIETLMQEVSPDPPCGPDLEYDPVFRDMEQAAEGRSARYMGKQEVEAAVPPDWKSVRDSALELFSRTKDLRVAIHLIRALLHFNGLGGLQHGLNLLTGLLQKYWDCIYPQLDPDDDNDPIQINILQVLCDTDTVLHDIRDVPLVDSPALGRFSLHYVNAAQGKLSS
ncbi:MAG: type VI secretion system protein TssA, partial [Gammaproteobacteria bacterium]|nr:type VI secretion system protein TssA [Gammaproteobacteria bacterium]